jgi:hypothetical protein
MADSERHNVATLSRRRVKMPFGGVEGGAGLIELSE